MNIYEKAGDLVIDIAKLIIGGVILGAIMLDRDSSNVTKLYILGAIVSIAFIVGGFLLYRIQKHKKSNFTMGLIIFIGAIGIIGTTAIGVVVYRNRDIVFPKKSTT